jgi:hypothetical protein
VKTTEKLHDVFSKHFSTRFTARLTHSLGIEGSRSRRHNINWRVHISADSSPASHRDDPGSTLRQVISDL